MATRDGCCAMKRRAAMVIALLLVGMGAAASVTQGHATADDCAPGDPLAPKEQMFATNNSETIAAPPIPGCKTDWNRSHPKLTGPSWPIPRCRWDLIGCKASSGQKICSG